jgi:hypothetical protein
MLNSLMILDENNVMTYFMESPFYERNSINQKCFDQKIDFINKRYFYTGIEFILDSVNQEKDLFIISKIYRRSYNDTMLISYYYIFKGTIFQSPDVYSVITSNIESIANNLNNILYTINNE